MIQHEIPRRRTKTILDPFERREREKRRKNEYRADEERVHGDDDADLLRVFSPVYIFVFTRIFFPTRERRRRRRRRFFRVYAYSRLSRAARVLFRPKRRQHQRREVYPQRHEEVPDDAVPAIKRRRPKERA